MRQRNSQSKFSMSSDHHERHSAGDELAGGGLSDPPKATDDIVPAEIAR